MKWSWLWFFFDCDWSPRERIPNLKPAGRQPCPDPESGSPPSHCGTWVLILSYLSIHILLPQYLYCATSVFAILGISYIAHFIYCTYHIIVNTTIHIPLWTWNSPPRPSNRWLRLVCLPFLFWSQNCPKTIKCPVMLCNSWSPNSTYLIC